MVSSEPVSKFAWRSTLKAAAAGNVGAQSMLGWCYRQGLHVKKNRPAGIKWLRLAAKAGDLTAAYNLGEHIVSGWGEGYLSSNEALRWLLKASEAGCEYATNDLGVTVEHGFTSRKLDSDPMRYYKRAAKLGSTLGVWNILRLSMARSRSQQKTASLLGEFRAMMPQWRRKAKKGDFIACRILGKTYLNGWGCRKSEIKGAAYFKMAIQFGDPLGKELTV